jgi:hypothetical protein
MGIRCGKNAAVFKSRPVLPAVAWEAAAGKARRASDGPLRLRFVPPSLYGDEAKETGEKLR